jgi:hypothetical protein
MATKKDDKKAKAAEDAEDQGVPITDIDPAGEGTAFADDDAPRDGTTMAQGPTPVLDAKAAAELRASRAEEKKQGDIHQAEHEAMAEGRGEG